jgi:lipooligosaccharide transport system permease protein
MSGFLPDVRLRGALHVWRRDLQVYSKTWKMNILPNFFEPLIYLLGMGIGLGAWVGSGMGGMSYLAFITPGLIVTSAMNGASFETTYNVFVKMHFGRTYHAITSTPVNIEDAMLGEVLWAMTRAMVYGVAFAIVVALFGLLPGWSGLSVLPVLLLTSFVFAAVGLCFTSFIKVIDMYSFYYTLFLTPMFLFSGIFFPLSNMPSWVATLAWIFPLTHAVNLARAVIHGSGSAGRIAGEAAWLAAVGLLLLWIALVRIRRRYVL